MKIRSPKNTDIFSIIRILGKMKIRTELLSLSGKITKMNKLLRELKADKKANKNVDKLELEFEEIQTELGMEIPLIFFDNFEKAEDEITKLCSSLTGVSVKEFQEMGVEATFDIFEEIKSNDEWSKLFTKALQLLQK